MAPGVCSLLGCPGEDDSCCEAGGTGAMQAVVRSLLGAPTSRGGLQGLLESSPEAR